MVEHAVVRNNCIRDSEFIQVTCYAALRYLADFKAGWSCGEGQEHNSVDLSRLEALRAAVNSFDFEAALGRLDEIGREYRLKEKSAE